MLISTHVVFSPNTSLFFLQYFFFFFFLDGYINAYTAFTGV